MKTYGYIYKIVCKINGKLYIGQTTRDLNERLKSHFYDSVSKHRSITKLGNAIIKYGRKNFKILPLSRANSKEELDRREIMCINLFDSINKGYNIRKGGQNGGGKWSEEAKRKMSIDRKGKPKPQGFGKKISKALKGKKHSESHRRNNVEAQKNCRAHNDYRHSEESKKKISVGNKGKFVSRETRNKIIKNNTGRKASDETKQKMCLKRQGRKPSLGMIHTEEGKRNISEGLKKSKKMDKLRILIYCENNKKTYLGCRLAAEDLGITKQNIYDFFHGKTKTAKGYTFKKL